MNARRPRAGGVVLFVACLLLAGATGRAQDTVNRVADDVGPSASRGASRDTIPARSAMAPALADTAAPSINTGRMWLLGGTMAAGNAAIMTYYFST